MSPNLCVLLLLAAVGKTGSAAMPVLKFSPNYSPIFKGENITMICNSQPKEKNYGWYFNNGWIAKGEIYKISGADIRQSGNYQCQTSDGIKSEMVTLKVAEGPLILQTTPYIHEGDRLFLRCHHNPGITAKRNKFYKNKVEIRGWSDDPLFSEGGVTMNASGVYSCIKESSQDSRTPPYTASVTIQVKELFTVPVVQGTPNPAKESDKVSLTCRATYSTYKPKTEMLYGFYKDGENIQKFSPANQYEIPAGKPKRSGKYSCAAAPKYSTVTKESKAIYLKSSKAALTQNFVGLALYECILMMSFMFIFIT